MNFSRTVALEIAQTNRSVTFVQLLSWERKKEIPDKYLPYITIQGYSLLEARNLLGLSLAKVADSLTMLSKESGNSSPVYPQRVSSWERQTVHPHKSKQKLLTQFYEQQFKEKGIPPKPEPLA